MNSVLDYLEESAERFPRKTAFADEKSSITFAELAASARAAGEILSGFRVLRRPVPVLMEKSVYTISVMMGVVYAGGFYVMLDAQQPRERISKILGLLDANVMVTSSGNLGYAKSLGFNGTILEESELRKAAGSDADDSVQEDGRDASCSETLETIRTLHKDSDPLYVLFTSGSTGVPKGVVVSHRNVIDFIDIFADTFSFTSEDVLGNQAPWDFDVSVKDIYTGLKTGATVQIIPTSMFSIPTMLLDYLDERKVTNLTWAVSALSIVAILDGLDYKVPSSIRRIMFSGEVMPIQHMNYWRKYYPEAMFVNLYGPTEITCNALYYIIDREFEPGDVLPMGSRFPNETVYLLDENDHEIHEKNKTGEICVSGAKVALGYYRNPEQSAKAFVQNPLNDSYREIIYRTGDLGYYNENGELCFASRADFQIKHMGHRIELGEIEHALDKVEEVQRSCCIYDQVKNKIVCFYQGDIDKRSLSRQLANWLPAYMVPNRFRQVESMPISRHGKVDRNALKELL